MMAWLIDHILNEYLFSTGIDNGFLNDINNDYICTILSNHVM